jgi:hypothetical protein
MRHNDAEFGKVAVAFDGCVALDGRHLGEINIESPVTFDDIVAGHDTSGATPAFGIADYSTYSSLAGFSFYVGGGVDISPTVSVDNVVTVWSALTSSAELESNAVNILQAMLLFNAFPTIKCGDAASRPPVEVVILSANPVIENEYARSQSGSDFSAVLSEPTLKGSLSGASLTMDEMTGYSFYPSYWTVTGATVNFGTVRGLHLKDIGLSSLAGATAAGTQQLGSYYGVDIEDITFGGNVTKRGIRIALAAASNAKAIEVTGTAQSTFAGDVVCNARLDINNGIALGGGAAATLGTIGGTGPTAAAQAQWVEIDIGGTPHWIPVWT